MESCGWFTLFTLRTHMLSWWTWTVGRVWCMVQNFSFTKILAFTEITKIQWISVISVFSSVEWPKFSLKFHQFFLKFWIIFCILFEFLCATKMTEIIWLKENYFSVYWNNWNSMNFNEIPLWCSLFLSLLQLVITP
jgi:hypothetical protein